nr:immunoglobulin heavy chain junction region [Macaca mulatta]
CARDLVVVVIGDVW